MPNPRRAVSLAALVMAASLAATGQTRIERDNNKYTPAQDVELGREAAQQVRAEMPMLDDDRVDDWVEGIGRDLVRAIPQEFRESAFQYTFDVVNQKDINAFALPGGPMFLNRGMIEAAKHEGEVAGVMAHEIAHVALRHGTAQATKGQKIQIGSILGQVVGAIVGGTAGSVIGQASQFGLGAYFLKFGREYERQADILGAQMMARAGYDPRRMADMFRTIEAQSRGGSGPEWMSSHPNPGNRFEAINREAAMLRIEGTPSSNGDFAGIQARLKAMAPAYTAEQIARARANGRKLPDAGSGGGAPPERRERVSVEPPSTRTQRIRVGNVLMLNVPSNWRQQSSNDSVTFAPEAAWYRSESGNGFTHGLQMGVIPNETHSHTEATDELIESLGRSNPGMRRRANGYQRDNIGGRAALTMPLTHTSEVTGVSESVTVSTVPLRDGSLLYLIAVAPTDEAQSYDATFTRMKRSVEFSR